MRSDNFIVVHTDTLAIRMPEYLPSRQSFECSRGVCATTPDLMLYTLPKPGEVKNLSWLLLTDDPRFKGLRRRMKAP